MSRTRKNYPAAFKTKVVIAVLRDDCPVSELASRFGVHSTVIGCWRREALASMAAGFSGKLDVQQNNHALEVKELHAKIGQLTVAINYLGGFFVATPRCPSVPKPPAACGPYKFGGGVKKW